MIVPVRNTWNDTRDQYHLPSCMRFLETSHAVEIMREAGPAGLHIQELAARADCDPNKFGSSLACPVLAIRS